MKTIDLSNKTLIFLHIHKTGGNSLRGVINRQYPKEQYYRLRDTWSEWQNSIDRFRTLPDSDKIRIKYLGGHSFFGIHEWLPTASVYLTFLRDPIDRTLSNYYFLKGFENRYDELRRQLKGKRNREKADTALLDLLHVWEAGKKRLEDFVSIFADYQALNIQTRMVGGYIDPNCIIPPYQPLPENAVSMALKNIETHFPVVGLVERFDESLLLCRYAFGWKNIFYAKRNITSNRPQARDVAKSVRDSIARHCTMDLVLYDAVRQRLEKQKQELGETFETDLNHFRLKKKLYCLAFQAYRKSGLEKVRRIMRR